MYTTDSEWAYVMNYKHYREIEDEKAKHPLEDRTCDPALRNLMRRAALLVSFSRLPAPWYSG